MIPSAWASVVLALGTYRLVRLLSYDVFPPIARARAWILGEEAVSAGSTNARMGLTREVVDVVYEYRWPLLAELVHCVFCLGLWVSGAVYLAWLEEPAWTLYAAFPFALSGAVGLLARNLDP